VGAVALRWIGLLADPSHGRTLSRRATRRCGLSHWISETADARRHAPRWLRTGAGRGSGRCSTEAALARAVRRPGHACSRSRHELGGAAAAAGPHPGGRRGLGSGVGGGDHDRHWRVARAGRATRAGRLCAGVDDRRLGAGPAAMAPGGAAGLGRHPPGLLPARLPGHLSGGATGGGPGHGLGGRSPPVVAAGRRPVRGRRGRGGLPDLGATPAGAPGAGRGHAGHRAVRGRAAARGGGADPPRPWSGRRSGPSGCC
jgi:hypothetical protein